MCLSSESRASFDWQVASTVRQEVPTVRHKKARAGRARDALTLNASIIEWAAVCGLAGYAKVCAESDDKRLLVMCASGQAEATLQGRYGIPCSQSFQSANQFPFAAMFPCYCRVF